MGGGCKTNLANTPDPKKNTKKALFWLILVGLGMLVLWYATNKHSRQRPYDDMWEAEQNGQERHYR